MYIHKININRYESIQIHNYYTCTLYVHTYTYQYTENISVVTINVGSVNVICGQKISRKNLRPRKVFLRLDLLIIFLPKPTGNQYKHDCSYKNTKSATTNSYCNKKAKSVSLVLVLLCWARVFGLYKTCVSSCLNQNILTENRNQAKEPIIGKHQQYQASFGRVLPSLIHSSSQSRRAQR